MADYNTRADVEKAVVDILRETLGDETKITSDSVLVDDLGLDSLDSVELIMNVEEKFGVELQEEDHEKLQRVSDVVDTVCAEKNIK